MVATEDLAESFRAGLSPKLDHAVRVANPFHVVRVGNRCLDKVRRRVQNETLGHRGGNFDPLGKRLPAGDIPMGSSPRSSSVSARGFGFDQRLQHELHALADHVDVTFDAAERRAGRRRQTW